MHQLIKGILEASRSRGIRGEWEGGNGGNYGDYEAVPGPWEPMDLISSAAATRSRCLVPVIAEIKPRVLGRAMTPEEVDKQARSYAENGACAISVLTEPTYFMGCLENARIARGAGLPILRKDFILDKRQLKEVRADLVLLIAFLLPDLAELVDEARSHGAEPLVEVHTEKELSLALKTDAKILGINNRDLHTLEVDLGTFERLAPVAKEAGIFLVAESGVHSREDALRMVGAGADALLVGTELMERPERLADINRL
jgi:indole-3-glycerol phosphate synthase